MDAVSRLLLVLPNWVGDVVLATPSLAALRERHRSARITVLCRRYVADVIRDGGLADAEVYWPEARPAGDHPATMRQLCRRLRAERFDCCILFPNSFRSAVVARLSAARRRIGYAREGRGWLLTDRLVPPRQGASFLVESMLDYYARLARAAGCNEVDRRLRLVHSPADTAAVESRLGPFDARPVVVLNPGGAFGSAKLWPAERFAVVGDALVDEFGFRVIVSGTPKESAIGDEMRRASRRPADYCFDPPLGLGPLKALTARASLMITNDTGPRHFAIAYGVPVVTLFGPTDPAWTESNFAGERKVSLTLDCMPCQQKVCPLLHRDCMEKLGPPVVLAAARELLAGRRHAAPDGVAAP